MSSHTSGPWMATGGRVYEPLQPDSMEGSIMNAPECTNGKHEFRQAWSERKGDGGNWEPYPPGYFCVWCLFETTSWEYRETLPITSA